MVLELAQPIALLLSILSLWGVFQAAFLVPATTFGDRIHDSLLRLALAAAIALVAGLLFQEAEIETNLKIDAEFKAFFGVKRFGNQSPETPRSVARLPLRTTLPMQIFCWRLLP